MSGMMKVSEHERRAFVIGNWKMNGSKSTIDTIISRLNGAIIAPTTDVVIAPPLIYLDYVQQRLRSDVQVVAQNCWKAEKGAFTGETSPQMILDVGCQWVIVGHPERRGVHNESDQLVGEKHAFALKSGLNVVAVIGDRAEERQDNWARGWIGERDGGEDAWSTQVLYRQLQVIAENTAADQWDHVVIAYEALWTMKDKVAATPDQAQQIHAQLRGWLRKHVSEEVAKKVRIVHAGFVNGTNCHTLIKCPDIDGFLLGGAALKPEFLEIVSSCSNIKKNIAFWENMALDCSRAMESAHLGMENVPTSPIAA